MKIKERILKPVKFNNGYLFVCLRKDKKTKFFSIHRLVAQVFLGLDISDTKTFSCHKDDNRENNHADNLFLGNNYDNVQDMIQKGRGAVGEKNGQSKLTEQKVLEIRSLFPKYSKYRLAKMYSVSRSVIFDVVNNISWSH